DKNGNQLWAKTYGGSDWDFAYSIAVNKNEEYVLAGETYSFGNGNNDVFLVKVNSSGDTLWTKTDGGDSSDFANQVKLTSDSGFVIIGNTKSSGQGNSDIL